MAHCCVEVGRGGRGVSETSRLCSHAELTGSQAAGASNKPCKQRPSSYKVALLV